MDYSLWGCKELDATERLTLSLSLSLALTGGLLTTGPPGKSLHETCLKERIFDTKFEILVLLESRSVINLRSQ